MNTFLVSRRLIETFSTAFEHPFGLETAYRNLFGCFRTPFWSRDSLSKPFRPLSNTFLVSRQPIETFSTAFEHPFSLETAYRNLFGRFHTPFWSRDGLSKPFRPLSNTFLVSRQPIETFSTAFEHPFGLETASRNLFAEFQSHFLVSRISMPHTKMTTPPQVSP